MTARSFVIALSSAALFCVASPAAAQFGQSQSYQFLQAIKDSKPDEINRILNKAGSGDVIINTKDRATGDGAIHIVTRRGDSLYLSYLLARGADVNLRNSNGDTALMVAVMENYPALIDILVKGGAKVDLPNNGGETPLIRAVQRRDQGMVRTLLAAGADPDQTDHLQGLSARQYAQQDKRNIVIAKIIDEAPKRVKRSVAGPKL